MPGLLVFDFDGTLTDAEAEGVPYRSGYLSDLATLLGRSLAEIEAEAERVEAEVRARPGEFGWTYDGRIVAPAMVDPYLRLQPLAERLLGGRADKLELLGRLYRDNYARTLDVFRPRAKELLTAFPRTVVVTNSHTDAVSRKLGLLGVSLPVVGSARKYEIDDSFDLVPAELQIPGLARPVLLRRRRYYEALDSLRAGLPWSDVMVCGDIFEMDLALPLSLGASVVLAANPYTPPWERAFLGRHPRARVLDRLEEILP